MKPFLRPGSDALRRMRGAWSRMPWVRICLALLLVVAAVTRGLMGDASGAPVRDAKSGNAANTASLSWSHTVGNISNGILIVRVGNLNTNVTVSSVTYGGTALTSLATATSGSGTTQVRTSIWYLLAPTPNVTNTVLVTLSAATKVVANSDTYSGVSQYTPFGTSASASGSSTATAVAVTANTSDLVIDAGAALGTAGTSATPGAAQQPSAPGSNSGSSGPVANTEVLVFYSDGLPLQASPTMRWTLTNSAPWVDLGVALKPAYTVSGTVYEDQNYGGGPGRSLSASSGIGSASSGVAVNGAKVELYNNSGTFLASTTTAGSGTYSFGSLSGGSTYYVRVVSTSVASQRTGSTGSLKGVLTYRTDTSGSTVTAATNFVGGLTPNLDDAAAASSGAAFNTTTFVYSAGPTGTAQAVATITAITGDTAGVDFGFNFDTVVNTNATGRGSLDQAIVNANTLTADGLTQVSGTGVPGTARTASVENVVFMISNGIAGNGLRSANNYFATSAGSYNVATIQPAAAGLTGVTSKLIIDAQTQPGWALAPVIELDGINTSGTTARALKFTAASSVMRGFVVNRFSGDAVELSANTLTVQGNYIGTNAAGTAASSRINQRSGILVTGGFTGMQIGGTAADGSQRNVVSGNGREGIYMASSGTIQGNYVGVNATNTGAIGNGSLGPCDNGPGGVGTVACNGVGIGMASPTNINVGGQASGTGNVIASNVGAGVGVPAPTAVNGITGVTGTTGITIQGNAIYSNASGKGIDLNNDGITANDGTTSALKGNLLTDTPIITRAAISGGVLTVTGYVGSAAGQSTFASNRVEVFISDNDASGYGQGKTYLGYVTSDANGNFSAVLSSPTSGVASVVAGTTKITATATDAGGNTSEFSPQTVAGMVISGTVFEDVNYGGGAGRNFATSGTAGVSGTTVELYSSAGVYQRSTSSASDGSYSFDTLAAGSYYVRVASTTVPSQRSGNIAALDGVLTYRTDASSGSVVAVTNYVGGLNPSLADAAAVSGSATFNTTTFVYSAGTGVSGSTAQAVSPVTLSSTSIPSVDFGFNFDTVVNTNASGQGSLAQAITNAVTLGGDNLLAQASGTGVGTARPSGVENIVFMLSYGTATGGLRGSSAVPSMFTSGIATIAPGSGGLPAATATVVIDAQTQPNWVSATANPIIEINGSSAGASANGFAFSAAGSTLRGFIINRLSSGYGVSIAAASTTVQGNWIGTSNTGSAASANSYGIYVNNVGSNTLGGSTATTRNVISGNTNDGIRLTGTSATSNSIQGNFIGTDVLGTSALGNSGNGIAILAGASSNTIGGTAANTIRANTLKGVMITGASTGNLISANSIYGNTSTGIDLGNDGITANDGAKPAATPNLQMDFPVFTSAGLAGSTLTVAGYVGSAANQNTFAGAKVELFKSDSSSTNGQGQTYLGVLTADANGNFSGSLNNAATAALTSSDKITATATDASSNTSEFAANAGLIFSITGTVFEDVNYGGGAGRSLATSSGVGLAGVTVELYSSAGAFLSATTTAVGGSYSFASQTAGNYYVRVASTTVQSQRSGTVSSLRGVLTYRTDATAGSAAAVTNYVGGTNPGLADAVAVSGSATFNTSTFVYSAGTGVNGNTAQAVAPVLLGAANMGSVDFGFNFDTVVNTNASGQGSLAQAITNANTLGGDNLLTQASGTGVGTTRVTGVENIVFMIANGSSAGGLRSALNYFSGGVATITFPGAAPTLSTAMVVDAQTQPGWTSGTPSPVIDINGGTTGNDGFVLSSGSSTLRGMIVRNFNGAYGGIKLASGGGNTIQGCWVGTTAAGNAAAANSHGIFILTSSNTIGGSSASQRNVLSGNSGDGVVLFPGASSNQIQGNYIGLNAAGLAAVPNSLYGLVVLDANNTIGGTTTGQGNLIAGNSIGINAVATGTVIQGNLMGVDSAGTGTIATTGVAIATSGSNSTISGNTITAHTGGGVQVTGSSTTGVTIQGNSIYGNGTIGIDLGADGATANHSTTTANQPNLWMSYPVFTSALLSGTNLTVAGYIGTAANQSAFGSARVEVFMSDATNTAGQGKTFLGALNADANGNFSGTLSGVGGLTANSSKVTGTATGTSGTSEFGTNFTVTGPSISGTVFEDVNYGGGAGRNLATSSGVGVNGATVELYSSGGVYVTNTTTAGGGSYTFPNVSAGSYFVRVASSTVPSQRSGTVVTLRGVMTYRADASSGTAADVTNYVGGTNPALVDPGAASSGATFNTGTFVYSAGLTGTAQAVTPVTIASSNVTSVDFGFNFDTVVNTSDSGQGSLRQAITNANTLSGDNLLAQASGTGVGTARPSGVENIVFMLSNGSAGAGLRSSYNHFLTSAGSYNVATITPTSLLPTINSPLVLDAQTQPGWTLAPLIELNGTSAGNTNTSDGLQPLASNCVIRGFVINRFKGEGIFSSAGNNITIQGNYLGTDAAGLAAAGNNRSGIYFNTAATTGHLIGGTTPAQRNVLSGNTRDGISLTTVSGSTVQGNYIGVNASGSGSLGNGLTGVTMGASASANTVGGTAAGAANIIANNTQAGVLVSTGASGITIQGNSIYGNGGLGIDLDGNGVTANDGAQTAGKANLATDFPVLTQASLSGTTLTLGGYVGSAAGQSIFASARVEFFVSDNDGSGYGQGKTYLGYLTSDANGNFSGSLSVPGGVTLTLGSSKITGTATDGSGNTSEFGPNCTLGLSITGSVFEDANYGGGAGRSLAGSSGSGLNGATVELYSSAGVFVTSTATAAGGTYSFAGLATGTYYVRVAGPTVASQRTGTVNTLRGVLTYRTDASSGTASAVTNFVGGTNPALVDPAAASSGATFNTTSFVYSAGLSGTAQAVAPVTLSSANIASVDFGFNFDTVVNTNATGQGSLAQAITNAIALGGDNLLVQASGTGVGTARTSGVENIVFMISNGSTGGAAGGLRNTIDYRTSGIFTITPASGGLPSISTAMVIDAQTQPGWTANPLIELNGTSAGASANGFAFTTGSSTLRGFIINRYGTGYGVSIAAASTTVQGNWIGTSNTGSAASANSYGIYVNNVGSNTLGGSTATTRNVISGNTNDGIRLTGTSATSNSIQGNFIGTDVLGTSALGNSGNGIAILAGASNNTIGGTAANTIRANTLKGVMITGASTGNLISANSIYGNTSTGIDLGNDGITANDGAKPAATPNLQMDFPVFTSAGLAGGTLTVAGYVGSAVNQNTFAGAKVEIFKSDASSTNGQGQTYLGVLTADASGNFSGSFAAAGLTSSDKITATATDGANNTSEFGVNVGVAFGISGTVFEDVNYGGSAGRTLAASSGVGVNGATVELYSSVGVYIGATTTAGGGTYSFTGLVGGSYYVRVVSSTVPSQRSGATGSLLGVLTYRTDASSGTVTAVTNFVGGLTPSLADAVAVSGSATFNTSTFVYSAGAGVNGNTAQAVAPVLVGAANMPGIDFGFNFDTVVNTNATGQGSLFQAITNANALSGDASLAQSGRTAAVENIVFMIANGSSAGGLRNTINYFTGGIATITVASGGLPTVNATLVIDAQTQPGWTASPIIELNGTSAGASAHALAFSAGSSTLRGFIINRYAAVYGVYIAAASTTVQGNWIGLSNTGAAASANSYGVVVNNVGSNTIGGTTATTRNVISGNSNDGIQLTGASATGNTIQGNYIGTDATGASALGNAGNGISIFAGAGSNAIGGTTAGAANRVRGNAKGIAISGASSGNVISANSIYGNGSIGIDLGNDGATANDGAKTVGSPNQLMDAPVFTSATLSGTTLTVAGYVGSAAGQSTFASATVEVFISDGSNTAGQGQTYLGVLTADASGNFSGTINGVNGVTMGSTKITATATDGSSNTSEFASNYAVGYVLAGTVYEDLNYGGGAGRQKSAASGGSTRPNARVELYSVSGSTATYNSNASTDGGGAYVFTGLVAGNYAVRVVTSSVSSVRSGYIAALLPVLTYRTDASSGSATGVPDNVGGTSPAATDGGNGAGATTFSTSTGVFSAGTTGTAQAYSLATVGSASILGIDFGFNFDTVVNANASGAGSLYQAITNANALGGDASLAQSGRTAVVENIVFMISNGSNAAGLRSAIDYRSSGIFTITPASGGLPAISTAMVIDAQTQPGWTANPLIEINGTSSGASANGFAFTGGASKLRGFIINRFATGYGVSIAAASATVQGNWIGTSSTGAAASANSYGVYINNVGSNTIGGTTATTRNVISGNTNDGIRVTGASATGNTVQGNYIGTDVLGTSALGNSGNGIAIVTGGGNTIGGTAAPNIIRANTLKGVVITGASTGNLISANSIYGNSSTGIDLNNDGITANDGAKTVGTPNQLMDFPVFTSAGLTGGALTVAGYVGSAAGQNTFAGATVEIFKSDNSSSNGQGQTYLGVLTADASGNFSGTLNNAATALLLGTDKITATATDGSNNTSEFGANVGVTFSITGTVFEDVNYGGGAGRTLAGSGGVGVNGAKVELYSSAGVYVSTTTTAGGGAYSFTGLAGGSYYVRVVSGTVPSQRSGAIGSLVGVLTFRTDASGGTAASAVSNYVGGTNPALVDPWVASGGATFNTNTLVYSAGLSGTAQAVAPVLLGVLDIASVDFGFNFDTVVNTNAAGQGSLAQAITNANTLTSDASLAQSGRPAFVENIIFMISNGSGGGGLRNTINYFSSGIATITPAAGGLPAISTAMVIDAQAQPGWTTNPLIELNGTSAGAAANGFAFTAAGSTLRGFIINRYASGYGVSITAASNTVQGNWIGTSNAGSVASANSYGVYVDNVGGNTIGGTTPNARNVISGNSNDGIRLTGASANSNTVQGNYIGTDSAGASSLGNAGSGIAVVSGASSNTIGGTLSAQGNFIAGNGTGITAAAGATVIQGNRMGLNASGSGTITSPGVGILASASNVTIGGAVAGSGNTITAHTGVGVAVTGATTTAVTIQRNAIYGNGSIGIDLNSDGSTVNDGVKTANQPNLLMDSAVFTSGRATGNKLTVTGYVGSAAGQGTFASSSVDIYLSDNSSGWGSGKTWLGTLSADGSGNFSGTVTMPLGAVPIGSKLTGTATDGSGNTSEFGANFAGLIVDLVVNDNGDADDASTGDGYCATAGGVCTLRAAIKELNAWAGLATPPTIAFAIPGCTGYGMAACTITPATALPSIIRPLLLDGSTQSGFNSSSYLPIIELNGANTPGGTTGLVLSASNSTVRGLTINRYPGNGITFSGTGNTLAGMRIGLAANSAATAANGGAGVYISGTGSIIGSAAAADANTIAGNSGPGVTLSVGSATLTGNFIGTDSSGNTGLGNGGHGVSVINPALTGISVSGNTIANNGSNGVSIASGGGSGSQVQILGNAISGNGLIGIDLGNNGVTANTGSTSASLPNNGMNAPVMTGAGVGATTVSLVGYIGTGTGQAVFAGARVEFFKAVPDSSGYGQGWLFLGALTADGNGRFNGSVTFPLASLSVGDIITATATDSNGNTSEFGPNRSTTSLAAMTPGAFNAFDASTAANALSGNITSKIAGAAASYAVIALDNAGTSLSPGFTGNVALNWLDARDDSGSLSGSCRSSWNSLGAAGTATFSGNNRVTVSLTPPASATRVMRLRMSYTSGGITTTACSNDAFAALPNSLSWINASDADSTSTGTARALANTSASGGNVHKAGRPFTVRAQALDATGTVMSGYDGSPVLAASGCLLPVGCTASTLTASTVAAVAGAYTHSNVSYANVGAIQLQLTDSSYADVDQFDTAANVRTLTSSPLSVGRFVPDAYTLSLSTPGVLGTANAACLAPAPGATFMGQPFTWATAPQVTVTAVNAAGGTTSFWTGSLMKLSTGIGLVDALTANGTLSAALSTSYGSVAVGDLGSGQASLTASGTDNFLLDLPGGTLQDSVTPTWAWSLNLTDSSEAGVAGNPTLTASASQGSVAFNSGGKFHTGRLTLSPAYGDVRGPLRALVQLQRYNGVGWITLTEDQGCVTVGIQNVGVESPSGVFTTAPGICAAPMLDNAVTTKGGRAWLRLSGTPGGVPGRLTLRLAGSTASGTSCTAGGAQAALVNMTPIWLLGGASSAGPSALATWGKPQQGDTVLRRETW